MSLYKGFQWVRFLGWFYIRYQSIRTSEPLCRSLKNQLESLGILGIKLGQYLCTRPDVCTPLMKAILSPLLTHNVVHDASHTHQLLQHAKLNVVVGDLIGSGSMAQVHHCTMEGRTDKLVIKVKHPDAQFLREDIRVIKRLFYIAKCFPMCKVMGNMDWDEFFDLMEQQIDMNNEKRFLMRYHKWYQHVEEVDIPEYVTGNSDLIVMTYCEGRPLSLFEKSDPVYQTAHKIFTSSLLHTLIVHYTIHGDVHEGNILVKPNGNISIVDFGICLQLSLEQMSGLYAISKYEIEPTRQHCQDMIESIIHPYSADRSDLQIDTLTNELYELSFIELEKKTVRLKEFFTLLTVLAPKHNVLLRGNIISFLINLMLLHGLSPFTEKQDMSNLIATQYMITHPFFKECGNKLFTYHNIAYEKTDPMLREKYKITRA